MGLNYDGAQCPTVVMLFSKPHATCSHANADCMERNNVAKIRMNMKANVIL